jgi:glycosyltransferase involved in cell wall biosynthesis
MKDQKITVMFMINDLVSGGAEQQLFELVKGIDKARFETLVVPLYSGKYMESEFKKIPGARIVSLRRKGKFDFIYLFRVLRFLRRMKVDVVQPFLTPATFFGLLPAILCRTPVKIVTERSAELKGHFNYQLYLKVEDFLSRSADWIVSNSKAGQESVQKRGIPRDRTKVIYNGINLERLKADQDNIKQLKRQLNISETTKVVGIMGSLSPVKDHATFLKAAVIINRDTPDTRFAILGDGPLRHDLENLSQELGIASKTIFLGHQRDVVNYLSLFDVAVLTSKTEGCSNSLLEAMALGKPVVATDVGGNRELVRQGYNGILVPFGDAEAVAKATLSLVHDPKVSREMGQRAKEMVVNQFSLKNMVQQYQSLYSETLKRKGRGEEQTKAR